MALTPTRFIWKNGSLTPWENATTHILTHALHYGSAVFEGIRCYETPDGPRVFRLGDHITRMFQSGRVYHIDIPFTHEELSAACKTVLSSNELASAYIRPIAYKGYGSIGVVGLDSPIDVAIAAFPWGAYLGESGLADGIDVCIASWQRMAPNTVPTGLKAAGNYLSSQLISMEAKSRGFAEGIGLGTDGLVSEGAGENLFVVHKGKLFTPPAAASILAGITRDTIITLAKDRGIEVVEQAIPREMLYICDEMFFTGTAAEVTPIRSIDRFSIGSGERPITRQIQDAFFGLFNGQTEDRWGWLDPVKTSVQPASAAI
ncbi:branched chain amino acid aminotransferase [Iodidimonas gelatinilytica]|uniref:Branched-chain-amino-acid aminotransferase n=2 Tax=Iodidimonas gelatinilytica TaxID=1236966 RepID=A0A5A7MW54_9PROT|nr:branched-chain amino acid transaminase [Iodidimonas gelatinilytica]GEQ96529.1 branched chain amino acid aminotransferase [Iodidimonas gelatinilytica]GER00148.1 branched chain amino acid aminotransferase [Iodidimonas gelatinilytica]